MEQVKIHFLNTIWSDVFVLQTNDHYALIDTATDYYYPMLKKHLNDLNIKNIDFILLTHFHSDHYGCLTNLIKDYNVNTLYLKQYYGLEGSTSGGVEAETTYIEKQINNYNEILKEANRNNTNIIYIDIENKDNYIIDFYNIKLHLYNINNDLYDIYNDSSSLYYNVRAFSENHNSIVTFFKVNDFSILLASDLTCENHEIDALDNKAIKIVKEIYKQHNINHIDVYKTCHHGHSHNNPLELLKLVKANYNIITNTSRWVDNFSIINNIKSVNLKSDILLTDHQKYIFTIDENITYKKIDDESLFIILKKD